MDKKVLTLFTVGILCGIFILPPILSFLGIPRFNELIGDRHPYMILVLIVVLLALILILSRTSRKKKDK